MRDDLLRAQSRSEGGYLLMAVKSPRRDALAARPTEAPDHGGRGRRLIEEHEAARVEIVLPDLPALAMARYVFIAQARNSRRLANLRMIA